MPKHTMRHREAGEPLYLKKVTLKNVRCFESLEFDLATSRGKPRMWGVILGDNGVGKTTLLRSIAIGLCDEASAAGLLREIYGEWNRELDPDKGGPKGNILLPASIRLDFFPTDDAHEISVTTTVQPNRAGYSSIRQKTVFGRSTKKFPWDRIFACGYGAGRRGFGSKDIDDYATLDAVYTLFNYDVPLQNPELVLRRIAALKTNIQPVLDAIAEVLQLERGCIELTERGLFVRGPWGHFHAIRGLGDGFQATLAWITDFLGWAIFYDPDADLSDLSGIVLIDEIEQHLHPLWQRKIIGLLENHFPRVQFIATTHTPMCAIGAASLPAGKCELIVLQRHGDSVTALQNIEPPKGQRADQVLTSKLFDLPTTTSDKLTEEISRYSTLKSKRELSPRETVETNRLFVSLRRQLGSLETEFETTIHAEVAKALKKMRNKSLDEQAVRFQVLRQLRKLESSE